MKKLLTLIVILLVGNALGQININNPREFKTIPIVDNNPAEITLTSNSTYYVNTSMTQPQIQNLFDRLPKNLGGYRATVLFDDGTYTMTNRSLSVIGFGNGSLLIGAQNVVSNSIHVNQSVIISGTTAPYPVSGNATIYAPLAVYNCTAIVGIQNIRFLTSSPSYPANGHCLTIGTSISVDVVYCSFYGDLGGTDVGLVYWTGNGYSQYNAFDNLTYAIYVTYNSELASVANLNITGGTITYGNLSYGGSTIWLGGYTPMGTTPILKGSAGLIVYNAGQMVGTP